MAATSQPLLQGGIRTRDWFSDKLGRVISHTVYSSIYLIKHIFKVNL